MSITLWEEDVALYLSELVTEACLLRDFAKTAHASAIADPRRRYSLQASDLESLSTSLSAYAAKLGNLYCTLYEEQGRAPVVLEKDLTNTAR